MQRIKWTERMNNEEALNSTEDNRTHTNTILRKEENWMGHTKGGKAPDYVSLVLQSFSRHESNPKQQPHRVNAACLREY